MANRNNAVEAVREQPLQSSVDERKISERELLADLRRVARETTAPLSEREYSSRGEFGVTTFRRRFGSWNAAKRRAGLQTRDPERIDDALLLDDLRRVARAVDGSVTERAYADRGEFGVTTLRRRFGSWNAAKHQAGLETERWETTTEAVGDDIARVAAELDDGYVTPDIYADRGAYPLAFLPTDEAFWDDLRKRVGLAVTPLYHKVVFDAEDGR